MVRVSLFIIVLSLYFGHGSGDDRKTLLTFNVALHEILGFEDLPPGTITPSRMTRRDAIIEQLNKSCADVICLQEVWFGEDVNAIVDGLGPKYPYTFSALHDANGDVPLDGFDTQPPCTLTQFIPFGACIGSNCPMPMSAAEAALCIATFCLPEFIALPEDCWTCIFTSGSLFSDVAQRCTVALGPGSYRKINRAGLVLLSRRRMRAQEYVDYHPELNQVFRRGYIQAEVKNTGQIVCTHNSDYERAIYYEGLLNANASFTNYEEQGRFEMNLLVERFGAKKRLFLLSDANVGPGFPPDVVAIQPEHFAILTRAFHVDPVRSCTFCNSTVNTYNADNEPRVVIDHIFFKGYRPLRKKRIFDDVTLDGFHLSDHFGVIQMFKCRHRFKTAFRRKSKLK